MDSRNISNFLVHLTGFSVLPMPSFKICSGVGPASFKLCM
jgi:hypothetical protein